MNKYKIILENMSKRVKRTDEEEKWIDTVVREQATEDEKIIRKSLTPEESHLLHHCLGVVYQDNDSAMIPDWGKINEISYLLNGMESKHVRI